MPSLLAACLRGPSSRRALGLVPAVLLLSLGACGPVYRANAQQPPTVLSNGPCAAGATQVAPCLSRESGLAQ